MEVNIFFNIKDKLFTLFNLITSLFEDIPAFHIFVFHHETFKIVVHLLVYNDKTKRFEKFIDVERSASFFCDSVPN